MWGQEAWVPRELIERPRIGKLSVVVAVRDEEAAIPHLYRRLRTVLDEVGLDWELLFVEDSSTDGTVPAIRRLAETDGRVKGVFLTRGFGHHAAITTGLDAATGDHIVLMDGDLQHRPEDIPRLLEPYFAGYEIVYGKRTTKPPIIKRVGSRFINDLANRLSDYPIDLNSGMFRVISSRVNCELHAMREHSRFLVGMISWLGFPSFEVPIAEERRTMGRSKYGLRQMAELAINYVISFSTRPLRLAAYLGLLTALVSLAGAAYFLAQVVFRGVTVSGFPTIIVALTTLGGAILFVLGIVGEYVGKIFIELQNRPLYVVSSTVNLGATDAGGELEPEPLGEGTVGRKSVMK